MEIMFYIISFFIFLVLQAIFINGLHIAMGEGYPLHFIKKAFSTSKNEWLKKSVGGSCIKCMGSSWGIATFSLTFIYLFGLKLEVIPLAIFDAIALIYLNYSLYKEL